MINLSRAAPDLGGQERLRPLVVVPPVRPAIELHEDQVDLLRGDTVVRSKVIVLVIIIIIMVILINKLIIITIMITIQTINEAGPHTESPQTKTSPSPNVRETPCGRCGPGNPTLRIQHPTESKP